MEEKGLDEATLAKMCSINEIQLSQILKSEASPNITTLIKISKALDLPLELLIDEEDGAEATVIRKEERPISPKRASSGENISSIHSLAPNKTMRSMEPIMVTLKSGEDSSAATSTHEGEEFTYILEGEVVLTLGGKKIVMTKGDSIYYDSIVPHSYKSTTETATLMAVIYTPW